MANKVNPPLAHTNQSMSLLKIAHLFQAVLIMQVLFLANSQGQTRNPSQNARGEIPASSDKKMVTTRYLEKASQVQVYNDSLIWLDRSTKTVYKDSRLSSAQWAGDQGTMGKPVKLFTEATLQDAAGIAVDSSGIIYIADAGAASIFAWTQEKGLQKVFSGEPLKQPTGIDVIENHIYVSDVGAKKIFSFDIQQKKITEEFHRESGSFPSRLSHVSGELFALDMEERILYRFVVSPTRAAQSAASALTQEGRASEKKTLTSSQVLRLDKVVTGPNDFGVSQNVVYFLDSGKKQIVLVPLLGGGSIIIRYNRFAKSASAIALGEDGIYLADEEAGRQVFVPLLIPANIYFEGGETAANIINFYSYLNSKNLLPTREYVLSETDKLKPVIEEQSVLPEWDKRIQSVICHLTHEREKPEESIVCNKKLDEIIAFEAGKTVVLPDLKINHYIGQREVRLPYDKKQFDDPRFKENAGEELENLAKAFAPKDMTPEQLKQKLLELNPSYKGDNILNEKEGFFLIPIESWFIYAYVVKKDLLNEQSSLKRQLNRNFSVVSAALGISSQSITAGITDIAATMHALSADNVPCNAQPGFCDALKLINYIPAEVEGSPVVVVIDNGFNENHAEFKGSDESSALSVYTTLDVGASPAGNDSNVRLTEVDHGTHMAALIGGRAKNGQMIGFHPGVMIYGIKQGDFSNANRGIPDNNGLNISKIKPVLFNISLGEENSETLKEGSSLKGGIQSDLMTYIKKNPGRLFMISAGNISGNIKLNTLPSLGNHDNVIVVGATTKSSPANLLQESGYDPDLVNVVAPGELINSAIANGGYKEASGTSQATAIVTGIAALLRDKEPSWDAWQIKHRIVSTSDLWTETNSDKVFSGMVNLKRVVSDTRKVVLSFITQPLTECKGTIPESEWDRVIIILDADNKSVDIPYRKLLRLRRNSPPNDTSFSIIFSSEDMVEYGIGNAKHRPNHRLERKLGVLGQNIGNKEVYKVTEAVLRTLKSEQVPDAVIDKLKILKSSEFPSRAILDTKLNLLLKQEFLNDTSLKSKILDHIIAEKDNVFLFNPEAINEDTCCPKKVNGKCEQRRIDLRDLSDFINLPYKDPEKN